MHHSPPVFVIRGFLNDWSGHETCRVFEDCAIWRSEPAVEIPVAFWPEMA